ncbi:hypothetical protein MDA_GLEAN10006175 [Myotis davidii]|uniref:Uncharacterized protein n=1 Tax=Myotis davidii TaxID=225400 RepID=L5MJ13_MYODS|nr:hypothetical protein MDA_GLEAN10006175 [Myotis davidii]
MQEEEDSQRFVWVLAFPTQKPSIIPHFKLRLLSTAFCGLAPPHPHLHYSNRTLTSPNFPPAPVTCSLPYSAGSRACGPSPGLLRASSKSHLPALGETFLLSRCSQNHPSFLSSQAAHDGPLHRSPYFIIDASLSAFCTSYLAP